MNERMEFQNEEQPSFEDVKQARQETWALWGTLDKRRWLEAILTSREARILSARFIFYTLKEEARWNFLLLILFFQKIKNKARDYKDIYLLRKFCVFKAGGKKYRFRITADAIMQIEKKLGKSLVATLESIQENVFETLIAIIWGAAQSMNRNFSWEQATQVFDDYIDEGHSIEELTLEIYTLFEVSDFFEKGQGNPNLPERKEQQD